jgi:hypothetical protein
MQVLQLGPKIPISNFVNMSTGIATRPQNSSW